MTNSTQSVVAKSDDGTIQITFTIPNDRIKKEKESVIASESKNVQIPGFRAGMAPKDKVAEKLGQTKIMEKTLSAILPKALEEVLSKEKFSLAIYPKFELLSAKEGDPWTVRATTCEMPKVEVENYKEVLLNEAKATDIWTHDKGKPDQKPELKEEEKETLVLKKILSLSKVKLPEILINQEVDQRLTALLSRLEKLALTLESYLASQGKTAASLRDEYRSQVKDSITLELALNKIAKEEKIEVSNEEIEKILSASQADPKLAKDLKDEAQKNVLKGILLRQKALKKLTSYFA